ncbi:MAG: carbamoyl phosphate synthase small subunit [Clostridia bacterium]|nr:carbamoyl phosphate synthase small subunit [Clostridia bacterium]
MNNQKVYLTLQNGKVFQGWRFGATGNTTGELVFSTGMVGYMETLTDPANYGQIVVQTFPLIGNYGAIRADVESNRAWVSAYVVREICDNPSNFRMEDTLETYLKEEGIIGIYGVDTRELTKILREEGAMNARISDEPLTAEEIAEMASYKVENALAATATTEKGYFAAENATKTVALWNLGAKNSTISNLNQQGYNVISVPANTTAEEILALNVNGVVISDGAGDPNENKALIAEVAKLMGKVPVMAIGLGHLTVALALGAEVKKQKYGHRGSNQPVKCTKTGKVYISMQNHSYEVVSSSMKQGEISFVNVNDGSCEGIEYAELNAFTVQFVPESCGIGHPENPLYDKFAAMTEVK